MRQATVTVYCYVDCVHAMVTEAMAWWPSEKMWEISESLGQTHLQKRRMTNWRAQTLRVLQEVDESQRDSTKLPNIGALERMGHGDAFTV